MQINKGNKIKISISFLSIFVICILYSFSTSIFSKTAFEHDFYNSIDKDRYNRLRILLVLRRKPIYTIETYKKLLISIQKNRLKTTEIIIKNYKNEIGLTLSNMLSQAKSTEMKSLLKKYGANKNNIFSNFEHQR